MSLFFFVTIIIVTIAFQPHWNVLWWINMIRSYPVEVVYIHCKQLCAIFAYLPCNSDFFYFFPAFYCAIQRFPYVFFSITWSFSYLTGLNYRIDHFDYFVCKHLLCVFFYSLITEIEFRSLVFRQHSWQRNQWINNYVEYFGEMTVFYFVFSWVF